ncbi:MAG TPA: chemotaxis response regulator protein-glutamate methylesterase [Kofleriaceae bacterium]|nr:chemotaxis response regulator protein-glutamate methylesterase [Kofleriaceae bacterium]
MAIRILVVDDSVVIRKLVTSTLSEVRGMEVVATAATGKIALAKIPQCNPDIVILDVEMPEMDGIETLQHIRKLSPRLPVIMFSTKTERGAVATIEALTRGASDYVAKPANVGNVLLAMARVREEMVPKIQALTSRVRGASARPPTSPLATFAYGATSGPGAKTVPLATLRTPLAPAATVTSTRTIPLPKLTTQVIARPQLTAPNPVIVLDGPIRLHRATGPRPPVEVVAIGASTGGPNALAELLTQLPEDFSVPIVIVQHMLATFTRHFAQRLAAQCRLKIVEASEGEALLPGRVYIARGDYHLITERRAGRVQLAMNQDAQENFCRPAVDVLFRSVAACYGAGALAVVLTGMGHDGLLGCSAIRDAGGDIIVQDEQSSVVWGMPGFVARAGLASQVLGLEQLGGELRRRVALGPSRFAGVVP